MCRSSKCCRFCLSFTGISFLQWRMCARPLSTCLTTRETRSSPCSRTTNVRQGSHIICSHRRDVEPGVILGSRFWWPQGIWIVGIMQGTIVNHTFPWNIGDFWSILFRFIFSLEQRIRFENEVIQNNLAYLQRGLICFESYSVSKWSNVLYIIMLYLKSI